MVIDNKNINDDYFLPGPNKEANRRASAKIRKQMQGYFPDFFQKWAVLKAHLLCKLKKEVRHTRHHQEAECIHYKAIQRRPRITPVLANYNPLRCR